MTEEERRAQAVKEQADAIVAAAQKEVDDKTAELEETQRQLTAAAARQTELLEQLRNELG